MSAYPLPPAAGWLDLYMQQSSDAIRESVALTRCWYGDLNAYRYWAYDCRSCDQQTFDQCGNCQAIERALEEHEEEAA